jgi:hypothetical protein
VRLSPQRDRLQHSTMLLAAEPVSSSPLQQELSPQLILQAMLPLSPEWLSEQLLASRLHQHLRLKLDCYQQQLRQFEQAQHR